MKITDDMIIEFEKRLHDLSHYSMRIDDLVSLDCATLDSVIGQADLDPHERAWKFAIDMARCCDYRLRAEEFWLRDDPDEGPYESVDRMPESIDAETREALAPLFYCAARLSLDSPWFESSTADFIALTALPQAEDDTVALEKSRPRLAFSSIYGSDDLYEIAMCAGPTDALDRLFAAYEMLRDRNADDAAVPSCDRRNGAETPIGPHDLPWTSDELEQAEIERLYLEEERAGLSAWREHFHAPEKFCEHYERAMELWRNGRMPSNAGQLAREGIGIIGIERGTSLCRDEETYYAALETLESAFARLDRIIRGGRS